MTLSNAELANFESETCKFFFKKKRDLAWKSLHNPELTLKSTTISVSLTTSSLRLKLNMPDLQTGGDGMTRT